MGNNSGKNSKRTLSSEEKRQFNRGQTGASRGERPNPPHKTGSSLMSFVDGQYARRGRENNAYWNGRNHHHKQTGKPRDVDPGSWCFITTATLLAVGKGDDCDELNTFRDFRDNWLLNQEGGPELVKEYYLNAPKIVEAVNNRPDHNQIYADLWISKIKPCYELIKLGSLVEAKEIYCNTAFDLKKRYCN